MQTDIFAKEARNLKPVSLSITLSDANAVAKHILSTYPRKNFLIPEINCNRNISTAVARIRTSHLKCMQIEPEALRSYTECEHCPITQLSLGISSKLPCHNGNPDYPFSRHFISRQNYGCGQSNALYLWPYLICVTFFMEIGIFPRMKRKLKNRCINYAALLILHFSLFKFIIK